MQKKLDTSDLSFLLGFIVRGWGGESLIYDAIREYDLASTVVKTF